MSIENMLVIITFIFPGAFSKLLLSKFANTDIDKKSYIEICEYISLSFIVLFLNFWVVSILNQTGCINIDLSKITMKEIAEKSFTIDFVVKYLGLTLFNTIFISFIFWILNRRLYPWIKSKLTNKSYVYGYTLIESIFISNTIDINFTNDNLIEIYKDGILLECGLYHSSNGIINGKPEILLEYCDEMKMLLENDKKLNDNEKIFNDYMSYCDIKEKILIKIYNMDNYKSLLENSQN